MEDRIVFRSRYTGQEMDHCDDLTGQLAAAVAEMQVTLDDLDDKIKDGLLLETTYQDLVTLKETGKLTPGLFYRITDYETTTVDPESRSVGHRFDVVVLAVDAQTLSEDAFAAPHSGDAYFAGSNLSAWRLKYSLENDATRFPWADTVNGKGVIYRMVDEWANDRPYDFKNIQFKRYAVTAKSDFIGYLDYLNGMYFGLPGSNSYGLDITPSSYKWFYTFTLLGQTWDDVSDGSLDGSQVNHVTICARAYDGPGNSLNNVVFANGPALKSFLTSIGANPDSVSYSFIAVNCHAGEAVYHLSLFGANANNFFQSHFRNNIIVGAFRHITAETNTHNNSLIMLYDLSFSELLGGFRENAMVFADRNSGACILHRFIGNKLFGSIIYTRAVSEASVFGSADSPINMQYCDIVGNFKNNVLEGHISNCQFSGQVTNCNLGAEIVSSSFLGILQYITIPSGTTASRFSSCDVYGNIRGAESSPVTLNNGAFRLSSLSGKSRRVRIEADEDGGIVATWRGAGGVLAGVRSTDNGITWANL